MTNFKNFFLGSGHDREVRETRRMHDAVSRALHRYPLANEQARQEFVVDTAYEAAEQSGRLPSRSLILAACELIEGILAFDAPVDFPSAGAIATLSMEEGRGSTRQSVPHTPLGRGLGSPDLALFFFAEAMPGLKSPKAVRQPARVQWTDGNPKTDHFSG